MLLNEGQSHIGVLDLFLGRGRGVDRRPLDLRRIISLHGNADETCARDEKCLSNEQNEWVSRVSFRGLVNFANSTEGFGVVIARAGKA